MELIRAGYFERSIVKVHVKKIQFPEEQLQRDLINKQVRNILFKL
jgi:hypothetical protein